MKLINPLIILRILSTILLIAAICLIVPVPVAIIYDEPVKPFVLPALLCLVLWILLRTSGSRAEMGKISNRDGYIAVTLSWILFSLAGSLPYLVSGSIPSFINAFFESASGFTTTGASILTDIEALSYSILFWRSFTHWVGGIGIIVLVIIILPSLKITAQQLFSLESSLKEKIHPKTKSIGFRILFIYLGLTVSETVLLLIGEMDLFESICHTFGTVATGGFSTKNTSITDYSAYTQYIITLYMLLAGVSYVVYYYLVKLQFQKVRHNEELWFYLGVVWITGIITTLILYFQGGRPVESAFRESLFQVISFVTTTGYITTDYLYWPPAAIIILFVLLFAGASTGSSTGSIKMARHLLVIKNIRSVITKLMHPGAVTQIRMNKRVLSEKANLSVISFIILFLFIFLLSSVILVVTGIDPLTAASAAAASLGNVGPGLGTIGPMFNYFHLPEFSKFFLSLLMIVGRLEILTVFALFTRSFWKL